MCRLYLSSIWQINRQWIFSGLLSSISIPSISKNDVALVSAMAFNVAIVSAFRYCDIRLLNTTLAASAIDVDVLLDVLLWDEVFNVTIVTSSSLSAVTTLKY